jgi:hypothetical protein
MISRMGKTVRLHPFCSCRIVKVQTTGFNKRRRDKGLSLPGETQQVGIPYHVREKLFNNLPGGSIRRGYSRQRR